VDGFSLLPLVPSIFHTIPPAPSAPVLGLWSSLDWERCQVQHTAKISVLESNTEFR